MSRWNAFRYFDDRCPIYIKDIFDKPCISQTLTRTSTMKLTQPPRRASYRQNFISFLAPSAWNNLLNELKLCTNLHTFKHKIKKYSFYKIKQKDNDITTKLLSSQQLMYFFSNFSFFRTFYPIVLVYQFCWRTTMEIKQLECFSCVILATNWL